MYTHPPVGLTLNFLTELSASASGGAVSDIDKSDILGNQAIKFTHTLSTGKIGTVAFFKNNHLYEFDLTTPPTSFDELWPDFINSIKNIQFN